MTPAILIDAIKREKAYRENKNKEQTCRILEHLLELLNTLKLYPKY